MMEKEEGRKCDVLVENRFRYDPITGTKERGDGFIIWTNAGMAEVIRAVPGVHRVVDYRTFYSVRIDKRYSRDWVAAEIEAAIKCAP